jgi:hypothetical protein
MTLATGNLPRNRAAWRAAGSGPSIALVVAVLAAFSAGALSSSGTSKEGAAAMIATLLLVMAGAAALVAWIGGRKPERERGLTYWDIAGALTFIGICVAQTIEPAELVALIEGADRKP